MINPNFFLGYPVEFNNVCKIYPPKIKEVILSNKFSYYVQLLTITQEDLDDLAAEQDIKENIPTPFEHFLNFCKQSELAEQCGAEALEFFIHEPVTIVADDNLILIGDIKNSIESAKSINDFRFLTEENYFEFQNIVRMSLGEKPVEVPDPNEHWKIKYFKAKARLRDRVKAKKGGGINFSSSLATICCMDLGLNPLNIGELSYCAMFILINYYQDKQKYDIDIKSILAGADSKKVKPKTWIKNYEQ